MDYKNSLNLIYDEPVTYKNLQFYPVTIKNFYQFYGYVDVLMTAITDYPKYISSKYLDWIYNENTDGENGNNNILKLHLLLCLVLKRELEVGRDIVYGYEDEKKRKSCLWLDGVLFSGQEFDDIRLLIAEQNGLELPNETIQKKIRDGMIEARKMRAGNTKMAGLEDQILALSLVTSYKTEDIYNMTLRKFQKLLERADAKISYEIFLQASLSGMVTFKDPSIVKHWLSDLSRDELSEYLTPMETVKNKISGRT
jgi:hypothetical protein